MMNAQFDIEQCLSEGPQSALEKQLVEDYLASKGYTREHLRQMPLELVQTIMKEACTYASLKLAELESKTKFREDIRAPT